MFIELVVGIHLFLDAQMLEQHRRGARVFSQNKIDFGKHPDGPNRDVVQISDRRRNDIELSHRQESLRSSNSIRNLTPSDEGFQS